MLINNYVLKKQRRILKLRLFKYRYRVLTFLLIVFSVCVILIRAKSDNKDDYISTIIETSSAVKSVNTDKKIYSLTLDITGNENMRNISLTVEVLDGLKVPATFFVDPDWIAENKQDAKDISGKGFDIGLLLDIDAKEESREAIMLIIATQNEKYYNVFGRYPKYIKLRNRSENHKIESVVSSFLQSVISYSYLPETSEQESASCGDICALESVGSNTPYIAARFIGTMMHEEFKAVSLGELLSEQESDSEHNADKK